MPRTIVITVAVCRVHGQIVYTLSIFCLAMPNAVFEFAATVATIAKREIA
jgi:hypothetical protein